MPGETIEDVVLRIHLRLQDQEVPRLDTQAAERSVQRLEQTVNQATRRVAQQASQAGSAALKVIEQQARRTKEELREASILTLEMGRLVQARPTGGLSRGNLERFERLEGIRLARARRETELLTKRLGGLSIAFAGVATAAVAAGEAVGFIGDIVGVDTSRVERFANQLALWATGLGSVAFAARQVAPFLASTGTLATGVRAVGLALTSTVSLLGIAGAGLVTYALRWREVNASIASYFRERKRAEELDQQAIRHARERVVQFRSEIQAQRDLVASLRQRIDATGELAERLRELRGRGGERIGIAGEVRGRLEGPAQERERARQLERFEAQLAENRRRRAVLEARQQSTQALSENRFATVRLELLERDKVLLREIDRIKQEGLATDRAKLEAQREFLEGLGQEQRRLAELARGPGRQAEFVDRRRRLEEAAAGLDINLGAVGSEDARRVAIDQLKARLSANRDEVNELATSFGNAMDEIVTDINTFADKARDSQERMATAMELAAETIEQELIPALGTFQEQLQQLTGGASQRAGGRSTRSRN